MRYFISLLFSTILFTGCSTSVYHREVYIPAYQTGNFPQAEKTLTKALSKQTCLQSQDTVCLLLDRATTRFAMGDIKGSIEDFQKAIEAIDYYNQSSTAEMLGQVLLQDEIGAYCGEDFEQILARVYFALALFQKGDNSNAFAILRQAEEIQQKKKEIYRKDKLTESFELVENPLAKYLMAAILEKRRDFSNASILYQQAAALSGNSSLYSPLPSLGPNEKLATVLVVGHNGNAPFKVSGTSDASVASMLALEILLSTQRVDPAVSSLTGIPVPILMQNYLSNPSALFANVGGEKKNMSPIYDITATAYEQLQQKMPIIVARGAARMALRRGTVAYMQDKDPCLGAIMDMAMLVANANTSADTRAWSTLPSRIDIARFDIPAGSYELSVEANASRYAPFLDKYSIILKPDDLCIINVFNIHPGVITIQIPKQFLINKGEIP